MDKQDFRVGADSNAICVRFAPGTQLELQAVRQAFDRMMDYPETRCRDHIWDIRGCTFSRDFTFQHVLDLHEHVKALTPESRAGSRTAIIADAPASYGVARMFQMLSEDLPFAVGVFGEEQPARKWVTEKHGEPQHA